MHSKKRIVIVAGEASGDLHASNLVRELLAWDKNLEITGIGGRHMEEAGVKLLSDLARFGVTGLIEVFRHLRVIKQAFRAIQMHLRETKPDLLIWWIIPGSIFDWQNSPNRNLGLKFYITSAHRSGPGKPIASKPFKPTLIEWQSFYPLRKKFIKMQAWL